MIGDKINIKKEHFDAALYIKELILPEIKKSAGKYIISIAGESGAGKSEIASALSGKLFEDDIKSTVLQQDDYFVYPPRTNASMRKKDIGHVGLSEVRLDLLDKNLSDILDGKIEIEKPLVFYEEDKISSEIITTMDSKVLIVDGTYTTVLKNVNKRIFIDRTYMDTKESRLERAREKQDEYLERILEIEHKIISSHKDKANIIITRNFNVTVNDEPGK